MCKKISIFICVLSICLLIIKPVMADIEQAVPETVIAGDQQIMPENKLFIFPATKETTSKRLLFVVKCSEKGLSVEKQRQAMQDLIAYDKELITTWAHNIKFANDRGFTRQIEPTLIEDSRLAKLFPATFFYSLQLPGYFGGAAPNEMILRSFDVPLPLKRSNIIAISKDGNIQLINDSQVIAQYFRVSLPPVKTTDLSRIAAAGYLRLSKEYIWQFNINPTFIITEKDFVVKELTDKKNRYEITAAAIIDPDSKANGELTVVLIFSNDGKLQSVTESQNINFDMIPLPPSAAPGGPGGGPKPLD